MKEPEAPHKAGRRNLCKTTEYSDFKGNQTPENAAFSTKPDGLILGPERPDLLASKRAFMLQ